MENQTTTAAETAANETTAAAETAANETAAAAETAATGTAQAAETVTEVATDTAAAAEAEASAIAGTTTETAATDTTAAAQTTATAAQSSLFSGGLFSVIMLAMSVYVLIGGISGKGKLFQLDGIKEGKEKQCRTTLRIIYIITGLFMALNTVIGYFRDRMYTYSSETLNFERNADFLPNVNIGYQVLNIGSLVMLGITMAGVVAMFIAINRFVDKEAARKAQEKAAAAKNGGRTSGGIFPADAFDFDDEPAEKAEDKTEEK